MFGKLGFMKMLGINHDFDPIAEEKKIFEIPLGVEFTRIFNQLF